MPQRFLRPGIRTSERFNAISRNAQALYIAILTLVDDYGRYDGRPSVLWADAFAVWNDMNPQNVVNPQDSAGLCGELASKNLVIFYEVGGKRFLQMTQWQERARGNSKYPESNESNILRNPAESCGILPPSPSPSPSPSPVVIASAPAANPPFQPPKEPELLKTEVEFPKSLNTPEFKAAWAEWQRARRKMKKPGDWEILFASQLKWLATFEVVKAAEILNQSIRNGWQGLFEPKANYGNNSKTNSLNPAADRRNAGTIGHTDWGEVEKRNERQAAEREAARLAQEQTGDETHPPAT